MKNEKDILHEIPEGSGSFYKNEDITPTGLPYDDAQAYDASGQPRSSLPGDNDEWGQLDHGTSWFYPTTPQFIIKDTDDNKIVFTGDTVVQGDLEVKGDITITGDLTVGGSTDLQIDTTGNIGLGTPNPNAKLNIQSPWPESARKLGGYEDNIVEVRDSASRSMIESLTSVQPITYDSSYFKWDMCPVSCMSTTSKKDIIYVESEKNYYWLEDLQPTGKPYDDAIPLKPEFAERIIKGENERSDDDKNTGSFLDIF